MARRTRVKWKNVLVAALAVMLLVGAVAGIASIKSDDSVKISELTFSVGALDEDDGSFVEYDRAIVSDFFECQGLKIEPGPKATGTYQVFYYDEHKIFVRSTDELTISSGIYEKPGLLESSSIAMAKYARIVIMPAAPVDEDGDELSFSVHFWEAPTIASNFAITVSKKQNFQFSEEKNLISSENILIGHTYIDPYEVPTPQEGWTALKKTKVSDKVDLLWFTYTLDSVDDNFYIQVHHKDGTFSYKEFLYADVGGKKISSYVRLKDAEYITAFWGGDPECELYFVKE